ncbi:hypothetical protein GIB67_030223 [Kingdonia uniflora]|uniref:Uncharacterized protein n=1 Tax=Kingdonia uniflora TaxID=39325 RepID=A0A7J7MN51_9MAGN|nr:hypothetical protein GIB67_030223 [Kingdonia uniflora]
MSRNGVVVSTVEASSRKRKDREVGFDAFNYKASNVSVASSAKPSEPKKDNRLVAGFLAHEFLTHGTLFGQKWDPAHSQAVPIPAPRKVGGVSRAESGKAVVVSRERYVEVARLLKGGGAHVPGVVNPTQLAQRLQM